MTTELVKNIEDAIVSEKVLYIFLDEAGNFDFSAKGTAYFTFTAMSMFRPFHAIAELFALKYDLWESGLEIDCFHAAEDRQPVRDRVFGIIDRLVSPFRVDCQIVEKRKTNPALQEDHGRFYQTILDILLRFVLKEAQKLKIDRTIVVADRIPVEKQRKEIEKAVKLTLSKWSRESGIPYSMMFHTSKSDVNLQITDYLNWAVFRKWERQDKRSYDLIGNVFRTEFETFGIGEKKYY